MLDLTPKKVRTTAFDPKRSISFLHSRRSAKPNFVQWKYTKRSLAASTYRPTAELRRSARAVTQGTGSL